MLITRRKKPETVNVDVNLTQEKNPRGQNLACERDRDALFFRTTETQISEIIRAQNCSDSRWSVSTRFAPIPLNSPQKRMRNQQRLISSFMFSERGLDALGASKNSLRTAVLPPDHLEPLLFVAHH